MMSRLVSRVRWALGEALGTPAPYKWTQTDGEEWEGEALIAPGYTLLFKAETHIFHGDEVVISFGPKEVDEKFRHEITGGGNQFRILATVLAMFTEYVEKARPGIFRFSAKEPSRKRLYDRLWEMFKPKLASLGYETDVELIHRDDGSYEDGEFEEFFKKASKPGVYWAAHEDWLDRMYGSY